MTPGKYNIWIYRGDTYFWMFELWNDDHHHYPFNLLGATVKAEIRDEAGGGQLRAQLDCYVVLPNRVIATLSARQSEQLSQEAGVWDLQINSIGIITTVVRGTVTIEPDVTDSGRIDQVTTQSRPARQSGLVPFPKRGVKAA